MAPALTSQLPVSLPSKPRRLGPKPPERGKREKGGCQIPPGPASSPACSASSLENTFTSCFSGSPPEQVGPRDPASSILTPSYLPLVPGNCPIQPCPAPRALVGICLPLPPHSCSPLDDAPGLVPPPSRHPGLPINGLICLVVYYRTFTPPPSQQDWKPSEQGPVLFASFHPGHCHLSLGLCSIILDRRIDGWVGEWMDGWIG
jgi:hypothetical protein